jgi:hypothetical protein
MNSTVKQHIAEYTLTVLMLMALLNSSYFFLVILKLGLGSWLAFNACSIAIIMYLICFVLFRITKIDYVTAIPLLPLYYYGTMGLFTMPWNAANMFAQITHIIITITFLWTLFDFVRKRKFDSLGKGILIGMIIFVPLFTYIQYFTKLHMQEFMQILK